MVAQSQSSPGSVLFAFGPKRRTLAKLRKTLDVLIGRRRMTTVPTNDSSSDEEGMASINIQTSTDNQPYTNMCPTVQPSDMGRYADLPPPPPPPQSAISPQIVDAMPTKKLGVPTEGIPSHESSEMERQHGELVKEREDLMGSRYQMQMDRKKIDETREKTGIQEGLVMDQLRTFLHKQAITLPQDIAKTFELIGASRDKLGSLEAEYDDTERKYTMKELKYSRKELEFVEKLKSVCSSSSPIAGTKKIPADSGEITNSTSQEKALEFFLQRPVSFKIHEDNNTCTAKYRLLANQKCVNKGLVNTLYQPYVPMNHPEDEEPINGPTQGSPMEDNPEHLHCVFAFGAQFENNNLKGTHGESQEQDIARSSLASLSQDLFVIGPQNPHQSFEILDH